ncbi:MAG: ABC transporter ATP-binding protein [Aeromonadaceae bacterium]|nr:ABC transporter ATP-binding protein [Aeromonadaceae bacterium]
MNPALQISGLSCRYHGQPVLQDLDLTLANQEILCLLGASGCGKTTLLKAIAGLVPVSQGRITLGGEPVVGPAGSLPPERRNLGFIFQDYALFPHLTVAANLAFGLRRLPRLEVEARVEAALALMGLDGLGRRYPHQLSGGQQQRVAIARALVCRPRLLLLDEPFSNIDAQVRGRLLLEIRQLLKQQGMSAIFVTHSKDEAFAFADRLAVFHAGQIAQIGSSESLYHRPDSRYVADFMGSGNAVPVRLRDAQHLETPWGALRLPRPAAWAPDSPLELFVRPQQLELISDPVAGTGQLLEQQFLGSHVRCLVAWQGLQLEVWRSERLLPATTGLQVRLRPHEPVVFPRQASAA